jgi:Kelch motif/Collagen triple helix repeat (20 copies)
VEPLRITRPHVAIAPRVLPVASLAIGLALVAICLPSQAFSRPLERDSWIAATSMHEPRERAVAASLPDGQVLVAGGENETGELATAEIYDPSTNTWAPVAPMNEAREGAAAASLPNGDVLVAGGEGESGKLDTAEIYDPSTNTWTAVAPMNEAREGAGAASLPDGDVLVAGGDNALNTSEIYDPETDIWSPAESFAVGRDFATAATLPNGEVLLMGGKDGSGQALASVERFDVSTEEWSGGTPLLEARDFATAATLPNGEVLLVGGHNETGYLETTESFSQPLSTWTPSSPISVGREGALAAPLPGGGVLVAGGEDAAHEYLANAEIFYSAPQAEVAGGDYGDQTVEEPSAVSIVNVTNVGAQPLAISAATLEGTDSGDFAITADSCVERKVSTGQSCTISVRFTPSTTGVREATIALTDNEFSPTGIALSGTGVAANSGPTGPQGPTGAQGPAGSQGSAGAQGPAGPEGATGQTGTQGPVGMIGPQGATGAAGLQGPAGPAGATGARGPAGQLELITCQRVKKKGNGKIVQTCKTATGNSPIKFTTKGLKIAAVLSRGSVTYATGLAIGSGVTTQLLVSPRRTVGKGHYTLTLKRAGKQLRETVAIG